MARSSELEEARHEEGPYLGPRGVLDFLRRNPAGPGGSHTTVDRQGTAVCCGRARQLRLRTCLIPQDSGGRAVDNEERDTPQPEQQPPRRPPDPPPASVSITPVPVEETGGETAVQRPVRVAPVVTTVAGPSTQYDSSGLPIGPPHIEPTANEPSRIVARYLFDGEKYCGEWRRHWIYVARWTSVGVISPFLVGYLVGVLGDNAGPILTVVMFAWLVLLIFVGYKL